MPKKERNYKRDYHIVGWAFVLLTSFLCISLIYETTRDNSFIKDDIQQYKLQQYEYLYENSSLIQNITQLCGVVSNASYIYCAGNYIESIFNYKKNKKIVPPEDLDNGADCKTWAVIYKVIADQDGWNSKYVMTDSHVFVMSYKDDVYCILDQRMYECYGLRSEEIV